MNLSDFTQCVVIFYDAIFADDKMLGECDTRL
jgi:hypothetical protein